MSAMLTASHATLCRFPSTEQNTEENQADASVALLPSALPSLFRANSTLTVVSRLPPEITAALDAGGRRSVKGIQRLSLKGALLRSLPLTARLVPSGVGRASICKAKAYANRMEENYETRCLSIGHRPHYCST